MSRTLVSQAVPGATGAAERGDARWIVGPLTMRLAARAEGRHGDIESRIAPVIRTFAALLSPSLLGPAFTVEQALAVLKAASPGQFDPAVVDELLRIVRDDAAARMTGTSFPACGAAMTAAF